MQQLKGNWYLNLEEKIQMNRLVQGGIDINAFNFWYTGLIGEQQLALTQTLWNMFICEYHYSTGTDVILTAAQLMGKTIDHPLFVSLLKTACDFDTLKGFSGVPSSHGFVPFFRSQLEVDRRLIFEFCVYLFGVHEQQRRANCGQHCSHWWHRNLKDANVVAEIMRSLPEQK
jgi:hypothetical protein